MIQISKIFNFRFFSFASSFQAIYFPKKTKPPEGMNYIDYVNQVNGKYNINPITPTTKNVRRSGLIGYKVGMTTIWDKWGAAIACTVVSINNCQVIQVKSKPDDNVDSIQLGSGDKSLNRLSKAEIGHFLAANVPPKKDLVEFKITPENKLPVGYILTAMHFLPGQYIDCIGTSIGKGFQGCIKRWNFQRQPKTHGNTKATRRIGSTGQREKPGKVFKGKKMPGHMGNEKIYIKNILVIKIDRKRNLLYLKGPLPGPPNGMLKLVDCYYLHQKQYRKLYYPTFIQTPGEEIPLELFAPPTKMDPLERSLNFPQPYGGKSEDIENLEEIGDETLKANIKDQEKLEVK